MYTYRTMTKAEREEALAFRDYIGVPLHEPPHQLRENSLYLITAACFEHAPLMANTERRIAFERELLEGLLAIPDTRIFAWAIMPNHYHVLAHIDLCQFRPLIGRLHNRTSTRWNREDGTPGRRGWFRFTDRGIRGERHYWATVNYIHQNPMKHNYTPAAADWRCSSIHLYLDRYGEEGQRIQPSVSNARLWQKMGLVMR